MSNQRKPTDLCVVCNEIVLQTDEAVNCDGCGSWTHCVCYTGQIILDISFARIKQEVSI